MWDEVDKRPDLGPRKRKNDETDSSSTPSSGMINPFAQGASMDKKRQKLSSTPQRQNSSEDIVKPEELQNEPEERMNEKSGLMIGEEIEDGYESEDVL